MNGMLYGKTMQIRLSQEQLDKLRIMSKKEHKSMSRIVRDMIESKLRREK